MAAAVGQPDPRPAGRRHRRAAEDFVAEYLQRHPSGADLDDADRQRLLSFYGISVLPAFPVLSADEAVARAADLGFEVILKATAEQWRMRPDLADIWRHIHDEDDMRAAWAEMTQTFGVASDPAGRSSSYRRWRRPACRW